MRYPTSPIRRLTLCALLSAVSACGPAVVLKPLSPPPADLRDVTEAKPVPSDDIVTSAKAAADYDIAVEGWGDRISAAGGRLCRWTVTNGAALPFACPVATTGAPR